MSTSVGRILLFGIGFLLSTPTALTAQEGTWAEGPPLPEDRTEVSVTTDGDRIFLAGGFGPPEVAGERASAPRALWVYDPESGEWSSPTELPHGVHHAGLAYLDGRIYLVGGFRETSFDPVGDVWIYDLEVDEWLEGEPIPTPRGAGALAVLHGRLHWIGGNAEEGDHLHDLAHGEVAEDGSVATHEVYDPVTNSWSRLAPMPTSRNHHGATMLDGRLHVIGGRADGDFELTAHEVYDPQSEEWQAAPDLPTGRSGIAVVSLDGWMYVFGGETFAGPSRTFDEAERFHATSGEWETLPSMPTPRHGLGAAAVGGSIHVLSGGPGAGFTFSDLHEILEPPNP